MKGLFAVFEGIDGSGKGTMIASSKDALIAGGIAQDRILITAEPTGSLYGKKVRELLKSSVNPDVNARQFLDLYVEDRKEHIEKEIAPALKAGKIILCDRYKYSTFVYQSLQGIEVDKIKKLHEGMPVPDMVFILDLPVDVAMQRINSDNKRKHLEAFEKKAFLEKVRKGFLSLKKVFPKERIHIIDSSQRQEVAAKEIGGILWKKLK